MAFCAWMLQVMGSIVPQVEPVGQHTTVLNSSDPKQYVDEGQQKSDGKEEPQLL